jgi:two-component system CheB/CheR fusion protein
VQQVEKAYDEMHNMLNSMDIPTIFLDDNLCVWRFSANAERIVNLLETDLGRPFQQLSSKYDLGDGQLDIPQLRKALEEILPMSHGFENYEIEWDFPGTGRRKLRLNARRIHEKGVAKDRILLAMQRVTEKE